MQNIKEVLQLLNVDFKTSGHKDVRTNYIGLHCPYCNRKEKYYLGINLSNGICTCWYCGPHSIADALSNITNRSKSEIYDLLRGIGWSKVKTKPRGCLKIPQGVGSLSLAHRIYLQRRGFDPDTLTDLWGIRGIGISSRLSWRIWIPVTFQGEVVSWTTRSIGENEPRYVSAGPNEESIALKTLLYGSDYCYNSVIVVEGPIDVWAIGYGAVATCGTSFTKEQINTIGNYPVRAICFDNEPNAQIRARRLASELQLLPGDTHIIELESGKDAASANKDELEEIRKTFLFQ
jgi:hypothetical protein